MQMSQLGNSVSAVSGGGVQTEALVASTPLIHYVNREPLEEYYPHVQAKEIEEIARGFVWCATNAEESVRMGEESYLWLRKEMDVAVDGICALL